MDEEEDILTSIMTKLLLFAFGKGRKVDASPTEKDFETVVSRFQILTLAETCLILGKNGFQCNVECFYGTGFKAKEMPFELRVSIKFSNFELFIYTDGAEIGGEKTDIRFEIEGYRNSDELRVDFLKELEAICKLE